MDTILRKIRTMAPHTRLQLLLIFLGVIGVTSFIKSYYLQQDISEDVRGEKVQRLQDLRKQLLKELCDGDKDAFSEGKQSLEDMGDNELDHLIVDDYHGIIYCFIPKVASTNWKRVMFVLNASKTHPDPMSGPRDLMNMDNNLNLLRTFPNNEIKVRLKHYTKFLFVRDPFVRLVSVYRDMFHQHNENIYQNVAWDILEQYGRQSNPPQTAKEVVASGERPSFYNFIQYLVDSQTQKNHTSNVHWRQMYQMCHPCFIEYDFVGHQETFQEDAEELLKIIQLQDYIEFPPAYENMTSPDSVMDLFMKVPLEDRRKLYNLYEADFRLFAYRKPTELLDE